MTKARDLADLLDATGDVVSSALDNVPPSDDASALTTGTLDNARLSSVPNSALASGTKIDDIEDNATANPNALDNLSEDLSPQLGANLDLNSSDITGTGNVNITGSVTATSFSGNGSGLTNVPAGVSNMNTVTFTSSGTYTPTSGTKFVTVYATGGGGGGGSAKGNFYEQTRIAGGGGSAGTAIRTYNATELGSSAAITMGSGGSGGSNGGNGSTGGTTTFNPAGTGTTITGNGGSGGGGVTSSNNGIESGGNGGGAGGGTLNISGTKGGIGRFSKSNNSNFRNASGSGAVSYWGGAGDYQAGLGGSSNYTYNGGAGSLGGGGGGGLNSYQIASASGGSGGTGVVVIMEYA